MQHGSEGWVGRGQPQWHILGHDWRRRLAAQCPDSGSQVKKKVVDPSIRSNLMGIGTQAMRNLHQGS